MERKVYVGAMLDDRYNRAMNEIIRREAGRSKASFIREAIIREIERKEHDECTPQEQEQDRRTDS